MYLSVKINNMTERDDGFNVLDYFSELGWPLLLVDKDNNLVTVGEEKLYFEKDDLNYLYFFSYNPNERKITPRYNYLKGVIFDKNVDVRDIALLQSNKYKLTYYNQLNNLLGISNDEYITVEILKIHGGLEFDKAHKIIKLSPSKFLEIKNEAANIYNKTNRHKQSIENYLTKHLKG